MNKKNKLKLDHLSSFDTTIIILVAFRVNKNGNGNQKLTVIKMFSTNRHMRIKKVNELGCGTFIHITYHLIIHKNYNNSWNHIAIIRIYLISKDIHTAYRRSQ